MFEYWRWVNAVWDIWSTDQGGFSAVLERRRSRLRDLLNFARAHSPFYRDHYRGIAADSPLAGYPPVAKRRLMGDFDRWVTDPAVKRSAVQDFVSNLGRIAEPFLGRYIVWTSSGTTGQPGIYLHDARALAVYDALHTGRRGCRRTALPELMPKHERYAGIWATGGHFAGVVSVERLRRLYPALAETTRTFSVLEPLPKLVRDLNEFQPTSLATYPTALELLAQEREFGRLHVSPINLWTGGEYLPLATQQKISAAFGVDVLNDYACSEFMHMAFGCAHGWLHVNADWVIVEPVDEEYQRVDPGKASHTALLTNLANRVQPFIRYDLGDSITENPEPCRCGNPLPAIRVEGRHDHVLAFRTASGQAAKILPLAITTAVEEDAGVYRFQLIQTAPDSLSVRLAPPDGDDRSAAWRRVREALAAYLARQGVSDVGLALAPEAPQVDKASGKLRQVIAAGAGANSIIEGKR